MKNIFSRKTLWVGISGLLIIMTMIAGITYQVFSHPSSARAAVTENHLDSSSFYPRVIRVAHSLNPNVPNGTLLAAGANKIYRSDSNNGPWSRISGVGSECCGVLWEVPQTLGSLKAGTLLYGAAPSKDKIYTLTIWESTDDGYNWKTRSTGHSGPDGVWEPEFNIDSNNNLVVYYSDETHKDQHYNQLLAHQVSTDGGMTWGDEVYDVSTPDGTDRPGMANVRKLSNGTYVMSYEDCGNDNCRVHMVTSPDGDHWSTTNIVPTTASGQYFTNTPTLTLLPDGTLLLFGDRAWNKDGTRADGTDDLLFVNKNNASGTWDAIAAPLHIQGNGDWCTNYSSSFLPSTDGQSLLELASNWNGSTCDMYYGTESLNGSSGEKRFSTGFENGEPQQTWKDTVDTSNAVAGGSSNIKGICCNLTGPEASTRTELAHSGNTALLYSGSATNSSGPNYASMQIFDLSKQDITVGANTTLSYWIYPQSSSNNQVSGNNSTCVAIDLIFQDDGGTQSNLRDSGAIDQNNNLAHPAAQCGKLATDTWNHVVVNLGAHSNGRHVIQINLGYDQSKATGGYRGFVDDVSISS